MVKIVDKIIDYIVDRVESRLMETRNKQAVIIDNSVTVTGDKAKVLELIKNETKR